MTEAEEKIDKFISYKNTDHDNPYDDPEFLKLEEIICFIMAYKKPYRRSTIKSLKNYRGRLKKRCRGCTRFPDSCEDIKGTLTTVDPIIHEGIVIVPHRYKHGKQWEDSCRVLLLKQRVTKEIRGPKVSIRGGTAKISIDN